MTAIERLVSLAALAVVCFGASKIRTVWALEEFKRPAALQRLYGRVNSESFGNALPPARVDWASLRAPEAAGEMFCDGKGFIILLDTNVNKTPADALATMRHEACHVATHGQDADSHGPAFAACKARLEKFGAVR